MAPPRKSRSDKIPVAMNVRALFEDELRKRDVPFSIDPESGRHAVEANGGRLLISLENLERDVARDGDTGRVVHFVDVVLASSGAADDSLSADRLYWCLEPGDHVDKADFRVALSDRVDRVLTHISADGRMITWVAPTMLATLSLTEAEAGAKAHDNLGSKLRAKRSSRSRTLTACNSAISARRSPSSPPSSSAPNLREVIGADAGLAASRPWLPDRRLSLPLGRPTCRIQVGRVGGVVVEEYSKAAYPISTEVYEISDEGVRAIGEFPREQKQT